MLAKKNIGILGAGATGTGIALTFALIGYDVKMLYVGNDRVRGGQRETMTMDLKVLCDNGLITESDITQAISRVSFTESMEEFAGLADIVIECTDEKLEVKQEFFSRLDKLCVPSTILATNTSDLSVTEIAAKAVHKERIIGTHFWKPAYIVPLVEVIRTRYVCDDIVRQTCELLEDAGRMPVIVQKDVPGFLADRMKNALMKEARSIVDNGIATPEDINKAMKYGFGMRLDPMDQVDSDAGGGIPEWTSDQIEESQKNLIEGLIRVERSLNRI